MELVVDTFERPSGAHDAAGGTVPAAPAGDVSKSAAGEQSRFAISPDEIEGSTDDALVRASVVGQRDAFGELIKRYASLLFWFIGGRVADSGEAEDVAQEALVRAFESLPTLRAPRAFANWLLSIADNVIREKRRTESRIIQLDTPADEMAGDTGSPAERLSREEFAGQMKAEMAKLPPHYRIVLALKYMNGYSVDEIATRLQVPLGTVRGRLSRAYGILRGRLGAMMPGPSSD